MRRGQQIGILLLWLGVSSEGFGALGLSLFNFHYWLYGPGNLFMLAGVLMTGAGAALFVLSILIQGSCRETVSEMDSLLHDDKVACAMGDQLSPEQRIDAMQETALGVFEERLDELREVIKIWIEHAYRMGLEDAKRGGEK